MSEKDKLIQMVKENETIIRYKKIEKIINEHQEIKEKIQKLKAIQKQLVNAKEIGKTEAVIAFQEKFDTLYQEIEEFPLMSEYLALQSDINDMMQSIQDIIQEGIEIDFEK
ncbi:MAG: YlbF family regulator [Acholeplasmataceae bacterium]|jgi:cell fate (sporulation/competence/biofilm development) regulator YmcA (YheA/YmcA/DUF963 family)|nr:YlbF family regulator [Acholeplasmataceae bacterium]